MVPLTTRNGLDPAELVARVHGRDVLVWGTGDLALDVVTSLRKSGIEPSALLHSRTGTAHVHGLPVRDAEATLAARADAFVVIAAPAFGAQARATCLQRGLRPDLDFLTYLSIARPQAVIDVADDCAQGCLGCQKQTTGRPAAPMMMDIGHFSRVVDKLGRDIPQLCHVELGVWGEPLRNPALPAMIELTRRVAPCTVSTGLGGDQPLRPIVAAEPNRIDITASGFGDGYESRTGRGWQDFIGRLDELRDALRDVPGDIRCQIKLYRMHGDAESVVAAWRDLLGDAPIKLSPQTPYLMPYDQVLRYCEHGSPSQAAQRAIDALPWSIDTALDACAADRGLPCLSQRVFPVIHADRSVGLCHLFHAPSVDADYLATPWPQILAQRHTSQFCARCQRFGLHRLDFDVLTRRHPEGAFFKPQPDETRHEH